MFSLAQGAPRSKFKARAHSESKSVEARGSVGRGPGRAQERFYLFYFSSFVPTIVDKGLWSLSSIVPCPLPMGYMVLGDYLVQSAVDAVCF